MVSILYLKTKYIAHLGLRIYIYTEFQFKQLISLTTVSSVSFITVNVHFVQFSPVLSVYNVTAV